MSPTRARTPTPTPTLTLTLTLTLTPTVTRTRTQTRTRTAYPYPSPGPSPHQAGRAAMLSLGCTALAEAAARAHPSLESARDLIKGLSGPAAEGMAG